MVSHTTAETACFAPVAQAQNRVGRSGCESRDDPGSAEDAALQTTADASPNGGREVQGHHMVEMAKLWGECAEDAERAEKKRIKVSASNVNANVNA
jgi:hypothetical protein